MALATVIPLSPSIRMQMTFGKKMGARKFAYKMENL